MKDLYCDHVEGIKQLMDNLATGTLKPDDQRILFFLTTEEEVDTDFSSYDEVKDYEWQRLTREEINQTWTCPVCGVYHNENRDDVADPR